MKETEVDSYLGLHRLWAKSLEKVYKKEVDYTNFSFLNRIAINLIKKESSKISIQHKRQKAVRCSDILESIIYLLNNLKYEQEQFPNTLCSYKFYFLITVTLLQFGIGQQLCTIKFTGQQSSTSQPRLDTFSAV